MMVFSCTFVDDCVIGHLEKVPWYRFKFPGRPLQTETAVYLIVEVFPDGIGYMSLPICSYRDLMSCLG
jgi:hypothetical protein